MDKAELMGEMLKQADVDKTQARVELAQALEELARLKAEAKEARGACYIASEQRDQARAERDAAADALYNIADMGYVRPAERARKALASLPHAAELAQAQRDVVAAARAQSECMMPVGADGACGCTKTHTCGMHATHKVLCYALARLDSLERGEQTKGETK